MSPPDTGRPLSEPKRFWPYSQFGYATKLVLKVLFAVLAPPAFMLLLVLLVSYAKVGHPPNLVSISWEMVPDERGFVLFSWIFQSLAVFDIISILLLRRGLDVISTELPIEPEGGGERLSQQFKLTVLYPFVFSVTGVVSLVMLWRHIS